MRGRPSLVILVAAICASCQSGSPPDHGTAAAAPPASSADAVPANWPFPLSTPPVVAPHGMVATDAPLATHVGAEVLRHGGNAVDAAVATAFALGAVFPAAGNIRGGGFLGAHMAAR